jgi:2-C-methyl-D-erythritol 2,4-cyclodiphosphate synthase
MIRIGNGYDVHAFCDGDFITLGGVKIPHDKGLLAHSDGDVLIHALCDALLGALALGDIGLHFPDNDENFKSIDSRILLKSVLSLIKKRGYRLSNCDCIIVAEKPKMQSHILEMRGNLSNDLEVSKDRVSVKATTTEKLGFTGREEGIAAYAVVIIEQFERDSK